MDKLAAFQAGLTGHLMPVKPAGRQESLIDILMRALHASIQKAGKNAQPDLTIR